MSLVRRQVDGSMAYGHPHLYTRSASGSILQDVTMASMSGSLAQLGLLSHYAAEMFQELFTQSEEVYTRLSAVQERTSKVVSNLHKTYAQAHKHKGQGAGLGGSRKDAEEPPRVSFDTSTMPKALRERYESSSIAPTPDLSKVDALVPAHVEKNGPCVRKYSYPGLFLDQWAAEEMERIARLKKKKAEKKAERKEKKKLQQESEAALNNQGERNLGKRKPSRVSGLNWKERYLEKAIDVDGSAVSPPGAGEQSNSQINVQHSGSLSQRPPSGGASSSLENPTDSQRSSKRSSKRLSHKLDDSVAGDGQHEEVSLGGTPLSTSSSKKSPSVSSAGGTKNFTTTKPVQPPPPPGQKPQTKPPPPPPKMFDAEEEAPAPPRQPSNLLPAAAAAAGEDDIASKNENAEYAKYFSMLRMGIPKPAVQHKMRAEGLDPAVLDDDSDDDADSSSVAEKNPALKVVTTTPNQEPKDVVPETPPVPPVARPNLAGGLLGAIQQGATLKKVQPVEKKTNAEPKDDLLAAIRRGGSGLRKAEEAVPAPKPAAQASTGLFAVNKILSIRERVAADDSDSDDDDDDWDDDDD